MTKPNIFFATDSSRLFLPWMSMLMTFIAVLVITAGMTTYSAVTDWQRTVSGSLTVQIPTYSDNGQSRGMVVDQEIETTLTILRSTVGVEGADVLSENQMTVLMEPWLDSQTIVSELPLPKLIDVVIDPNNPPDLTQLKSDLAVQVPAAVLDSHRTWLTPLLRISSGVVKLVFFILILLVLTSSITVIYATRTSLRVHEPVISLIHMIGANDLYVTRQYAERSFQLTLTGGLFGFFLTLPIMAGVSFFIRGANFDFFSNPILTLSEWSVLISVPFVLSVLAFITTFKTVMDYLKRFL